MENFYSYKNKMPEENLNLEGNVGAVDPNTDATPIAEDSNIATENYSTPMQDVNNQDLANLEISEENTVNPGANEEYVDTQDYIPVNNFDANNTASMDGTENTDTTANFDEMDFNAISEGSSSIDSNVFLDYGDDAKIVSRPTTDDSENFGKYLRIFFGASVIATLGIIAFVMLYSFNTFISKASQRTIDSEYVEFVQQYKDKLGKVKKLLKKNNIDNYSVPNIRDENASAKINEIINATDIDYIEKKDLLSPFVSELVTDSEISANQIEIIKQDIARQGFLPEEISEILSEEQAIDTIQRSLNALEVIRFSTATKVFSYMDTAIIRIADMIRVAGGSVDAISNLLEQLNSRGEKDISAYVYMCYLNPFETSANCDNIGDLDLYYNNIIKDNSINTRLFKNVMNAINQILEKGDSTLFSITFNGFNAQDKDITFRIEVYTNQTDEKALLAKGQKNPNIFILKNIISLLKQSSFIIGAQIQPNEVRQDPKTITTAGGLSMKVNYSNMDFTVPLQKNTEREIFDYIDIDNLQKLLDSLKHNPNDELNTDSETTSTTEDYSNIDDTQTQENNESDLSISEDQTQSQDETGAGDGVEE